MHTKDIIILSFCLVAIAVSQYLKYKKKQGLNGNTSTTDKFGGSHGSSAKDDYEPYSGK
jgi:hypothetical protein